MSVDISPEAVAQMLDGVTPGPWHAAGPPWNQIIYSSRENRIAFTAHSDGLDDDRDIATARFIAWSREAVPALATRVAELEAANRELGLQCIADLGQAQEAWEAQKAAEAEARALVAAALQRAADEINARGVREEADYGLTRGTQNFYRARDIVRSLIDTDHAAALEAVKAQARQEAWKELQTERPFILGANHGWDEGVADTLETVAQFVDAATLDHIAAAIRAGKVQL